MTRKDTRLSAILKAAKDAETHQLPWARGATRAATLARRKGQERKTA